MKIKLTFLLVIFLNSSFYCNAQNEKLRFSPEAGKQYIYEFAEASYIIVDNSKKRNRFVKRKSFDIKFDTFQPENTQYLKVCITKNVIEKPDKSIQEVRDYKYPYFQEAFPGNSSPNFTETLLSRLTFKYSFDFETSRIKLLNLEELLLEARKILEEKGLSKGKVDNRIIDFNEKIIPQTTRQIQSVFEVTGISFSEGNLNNEVFETSVDVKNTWTKLSLKRREKSPGLYSKNIVYNTEKHYLKEYNTVEIDSIEFPVWLEHEKYYLKYTENNIHLKVAQNIAPNHFIISGKMENQKNKKVTLAVLRNPFGTKLFEKSVFLDENNSFQIETEIAHPQLVYLQFGSLNFIDQLPLMAFYAEPGSRIHFDASGDTFPWEVTFTGDFAGASRFLYDFRSKYNIFNQRLDWNTINYYRFDNFSYNDFSKAFDDIRASEYNDNVEEHAFNFIRNEIKAYLFNMLVNYLQMEKFIKNYPNGGNFFQSVGEENFSKMKNMLDIVNIYSFYNEYGIHSRQLAESYLNYFFVLKKKVRTLTVPDFYTFMANDSYSNYSDLPCKVEAAKTILAGHPFYSVITDLLLSEKMNVSNTFSQYESYTQEKTNNYLNLIALVCNDNEFINSVKEGIDNQYNWENKSYVPSAKFFNEKAEPVYMSDFFGAKPTVFYITSDWARERYFWDDLAKENPQINFVLVMEGSNIKEWLDYEKRAEPIAHQLFLVNEELTLQDIFKSNNNHFVLYDKSGVRIGFAEDAVTARNMAKQSLEAPPKQFNKSQLKLIIFILFVSLVALFVAVLYWKWRVRMRLRKEEQTRRLRELELTAIRSQMNPHFLFNSLNSVQNLVQQNKGREAHLYLADFAGLIRKVLQNSEKEEVSLAEELEMVKQYLSLERLRFDFEYQLYIVPDIDAHNTMVPSMLLQPFVENAVNHGLQNKDGERKLKIEVVREGSEIKICIEDNGVGREAAKEISKTKNGKSSKLIKERLAILEQKQGEHYRLEIIDLDKDGETGTRVEVSISDES